MSDKFTAYFTSCYPVVKRRLGQPVNGLLLGAVLVTGLSQARVASAHGSVIEVTQSAVEINAAFDNGEPMADAQVLIYSPSDLESPWKKGQTNAEGMYLFTPDAETPGPWEVTVRKAGHGGTTTFTVDGEGGLGGSGSQSVASSVPKWISMAAIVWGFVGTALFFSRKPAASPKPTTPESSRAAAEPVPVSSTSGGQH